MMGIRVWRKLSKERTEWRGITEKAKTHSGFNASNKCYRYWNAAVQSSLAFRGFVLRGLSNLWGRPKNTNASLRTFNGQEYQKCLIDQRGLRAILYDVQGTEKETKAAPIVTFLQIKEK
jgi:hypothetical protein